MNNRQFFFNHIAQTSPAPPALEVKSAKGVYLYGADGKKYMDLISGISVSNLGHSNSKVTTAIKKQLGRHGYLMVYGEYIVAPQIEYARELIRHLPVELNNIYYVNSGSEAIEGALKLAKRYTGRTEIMAFKNAYHGSTHGALSVMGDETMKQAFRPLLPDVTFLEFNNESDIEKITIKTACVLVEPIQGEAGVILPQNNFLKKLRKRCDATDTLLLFDEIQTGMGRTGSLFAFERYNVVPDVLCLAKAFGGGMPLGAFISSKEIMSSIGHDPVLGHITTYGGHPISCVAGLAALKETVSKKMYLAAEEKGQFFKKLLKHPAIKEVRGHGLLLAVQFAGEIENRNIINHCLRKGLVVDWFLFNSSAMRIAPPLIISNKEIEKACFIILDSI